MFLTVHLKKSCSTGELLMYFLISLNSAEASVQWPNWKLSKFLLDCLYIPSKYLYMYNCLFNLLLKTCGLIFSQFCTKIQDRYIFAFLKLVELSQGMIPQYFRLAQSHEDVSGYFILSRILFSINENNF